MSYMYAGAILLINLTEGKVSTEPTASYSGAFLGGRGINTRLLYDKTSRGVDPLGPANVLIFGTGPLCGTPCPASRTEVTTRSPETGYLGSANFGGYFGPELKFAGYDHIVISGRADKPVYIWIDNDTVEIRDAGKLWGKDTYETQALLRAEVNPDAQIACIGPAGEKLVRFSTIQHGLKHSAARTGAGCVMGSKNLKAIVVRGNKRISLASPDKYLTLAKKLQQDMLSHPGVQMKHKYGHSYDMNFQRMRAGRNQVPRPSTSYDLLLKYKSGVQRTGCFGCPTQCQDLYPKEAKGGGAISCAFYSAPFYEVRNTDIEAGLEAGFLCQRYGVDLKTSMVTISWLMELHERGIITAKDTDGIPMEWGSPKAIIGMLHKIARREGFGDVLADGIIPAARKIGRGALEYAPQVKGLPPYGPSSPDSVIPEKGLALSLAVSSRGDNQEAKTKMLEEKEVKRQALWYDYGEQAFQYDDVKAGGRGAEYLKSAEEKAKRITGTEKAFLPGEYAGKPELVIYFEDTICMNDCLGVCKLCSIFIDVPFNEEHQAALFSAGTGTETTVDMLFQIARRVRTLERAYCAREGMTREMDSLPKRFMDTPVERGVFKGAVLESSKFEEMKSHYYALRGWDIATGIPTRETLEQMGLGDIAQDLEQCCVVQAEPPKSAPDR